MRAQDFLNWMKVTNTPNAVSVGEQLGLARETARKMVAAAKDGHDVEVKLTVQLAMTAIANGLRPWGDYDR